MNKYDIIFESLQERLSNNELSFEEASVLNELAYSKYVTESSEEYSAEKEAEFLGKYRSLVSEYKSDYLKVLTATKKPKKVNVDYAKMWISSCENDLNKMIDLLKHTPLLSKKALANSNKFIKTLAITVGSTVAIVAGINEAKKLALAATDKEKSKVYDKLAKKPGKNPVEAQERKYKAAVKTIDLNNRKEAIDKKAKVLAKMTVGAGTLATAGIIAANQIPLYNRNREKFIQEQSAYISKCRNSLNKVKEKLNGVKALKESTAEEIYDRCINMFESVNLEDETYTESTGNNKLLKRALNACKSDMKRDKKLVKEAIQAREFADAHNYIKKTKDDLKEMKEIVKKVPTDAMDDAIPHIMFNLTEFSTNLLTAFAYRTLMKHVDADKLASNKSVFDVYSNSTPQGQQAILKGLNHISDESRHNKSTNTATKVKESLTKAAKGIPESVSIDALMTGYRKLKTKDEFTTNTYKNKVLIAIDAEIKKLDKLDKMVSVAELKK